MTPQTNPYTPMLISYSARHVFGRDSMVSAILQAISGPETNGQAISGMRSMGKTTLLRFLKDPDGALQRFGGALHPDYQPGSSRQFVFVLLDCHGYSAEDDIFYDMLCELEELIEDEDLGEQVHVPSLSADAPPEDLLAALRQALRDLDEIGLRVVFLMDDFEEALPHVSLDDERLLRSLSDMAVFIIVTEDPLSVYRGSRELGDSPLLSILRPMSLGLLKESAARQLITQPLADAAEPFSEAEIRLLLGVAGQHAFSLTAACEQYFDMRRDYPDLSQRLEAEAARTAFAQQFIFRLSRAPHVDRVLNLIWGRLSDEEHQVLIQMPGTLVDVQSPLANAAERLTPKGLVRFDPVSGQYTVFSALFAYFIQQRAAQPAAPALDAHALLNADLTPIDRELLKYLLERANTVCSFDELRRAVWKDPDTSKRALEAAVYRLRGHLEAAKQRATIKNVRGQGYTLVLDETRPGPLKRHTP